jgi:hypothetical protein
MGFETLSETTKSMLVNSPKNEILHLEHGRSFRIGCSLSLTRQLNPWRGANVNTKLVNVLNAEFQ